MEVINVNMDSKNYNIQYDDDKVISININNLKLAPNEFIKVCPYIKEQEINSYWKIGFDSNGNFTLNVDEGE